MKDSLGNTIPKNAFIIRHTEVSEFRNCKRKWFIGSHNGLNLEPIFSDPKLKFGTAWHYMLEKYYEYRKRMGYNLLPEGVMVQMMADNFLESLDKEFDELLTEIAVEGIPVTEDESISDVYIEMKDLGLALIPEYLEWSNSVECFPTDKELEIMMLEQRLIVPVPNTRCYLSAKIDGLVKFGEAYYILEHKTRSKSSSVTNPGELQLDIQLGVQQWVARQALPDYNIVGSIYNLARKQKPSAKVKAPLFGRHLTYRSTYELTHLIDSIVRNDYPAMRKCKKDRLSINWNPQPVGLCSWGCKANKICTATNRDEDVDYLLNTFFKPRTKSIWEVLEEEME